MLRILQSSQQDKLKRLLSVMLPIIGTQIATIGMNFFDASMSGQAGAVDLAGTAIGGNIWMPVQTGINGVLMAGMPLVAHLEYCDLNFQYFLHCCYWRWKCFNRDAWKTTRCG